MDKLNDWTKAVIAWAKDRPADAILVVTSIIVSYKIGEAIGDAIVKNAEVKSQS